MIILECRVNKPYPEVNVEQPNIEYAKLLLDDYASSVGEDRAIHQYIYQSFTKFNNNPIFANTLSQIAMVEMRHLELLGKTIKLLGINPEFRFINKNTNCLVYWNSSFVNYTTNIIDMLKSDIAIEEEAIRNYSNHIKIINDKYIKALLYRIIEDEKMHIKCFNILMNMVVSRK